MSSSVLMVSEKATSQKVVNKDKLRSYRVPAYACAFWNRWVGMVWSRKAGLGIVRMPHRSRTGSDVEKPHETLDTLRQIRSKLDEARTLSESLGTPEEPYNLKVTLDTIVLGIDAQIGALANAGEPNPA